MATLTISNDFHGTSTTVRPVGGTVSASAWRAAKRRLCAIKGCACGGIRGAQSFEPTHRLVHDSLGGVYVVREEV